MSCRTGCPTRDHSSWGECARASGLQFGDGGQRASSKKWDGELAEYASARRQGVSPKTTKLADTRTAMKLADATGIMRW